MKLSFKNKNTKLTKRVDMLIEEKSVDFKKKYKLYSMLSEVKLSNERKSELECYINTLVETNGISPNFISVKSFVKDCLEDNRVYNAQGILLQIENYLNLKHKSSLKESIINDVLNTVLVKNYKLDNKIYETLIESVNRKTGIFFESDDSGSKPSTITTGYGTVVDLDQFMKNAEGVGNEAAREVEVQANRSEPDTRIKKEKILGNTNKIKTELDKMHSSVVPIIHSMSNKAQRKVWIIFHIHSYLNVFRNFTPPMSDSERNAISKKSELGQYSSMKSGLTADEIDELKSKLDNILVRNSEQGDINFENDSISENELLQILRSAMGHGTNVNEDYNIILNELRSEFPIESDPSLKTYEPPNIQNQRDRVEALKDVPDMSDEEFESEQEKDNIKNLVEDIENIVRNAQIDAEESKELARESGLEEHKSLSEQAFEYFEEAKSEMENVKSSRTLKDAEAAAELVKDSANKAKEIFELIQGIPEKVTDLFEIYINCDDLQDKAEAYEELYNELQKLSQGSMEVYMSYVKQFFGQDLYNKPTKYADIARLSGGDFRGSAGARQDLMKMWMKASFFSSEDRNRSRIYAALGDKWIEALRRLDLVEDENIEFEDLKSSKGTKIVDYFHKLSGIIERDKNILGYLDGTMSADLESDIVSMGNDFVSKSPEMEKLQIIDVLLNEPTSFRVFSSRILNDYYNKYIYKVGESKLALAVKDYFNENVSKDGRKIIDQSNLLKPGGKSGDVNPKEGRLLFNTIIYFVMERASLVENKNNKLTPQEIIGKRKEKFIKNFRKVLEKYNNPENKELMPLVPIVMSEKQINDLVDDMSNPNGKIGGEWSQYNMLNNQRTDELEDWILNLQPDVLKKAISEALLYSEQFKKETLVNKSKESAWEKAAGKIRGEYEKAIPKDQRDQQDDYLGDIY